VRPATAALTIGLGLASSLLAALGAAADDALETIARLFS